MRKNTTQLDYTSGFTALFSILFWLASAFSGLGLRFLFPDFDGLPLFLLLLVAMALACTVNRVAARIFARNHFGMPPEERRALLDRHAEECKADPEAVLARYKDMEAVPVFTLSLYFVLVFALGASAPLVMYEGCSLLRAVVGAAGLMFTSLPFGFMPVYRIVETLQKPLHQSSLVPVGSLPRLEELVRRASDTVGIKGAIRLELTRDCDCDVNRFGKTYVVFLGTRMLSALTEEELYQALLMALDCVSRPSERRHILLCHRLGMLGAADVRPVTCVFDLFYSYADATLEWEYELYLYAYRQLLDHMEDRRILSDGDPAAAVSARCKRAMWRYFAYESTRYLTTPVYESPEPQWRYEWEVCDAFRRALTQQHTVWLDMLSRELYPDGERYRPLFREQWPRLVSALPASVTEPVLPDLQSPYGREVMAAVEQTETRIRQEMEQGYTSARKHEYLTPLATVEAYEASPEGYSTPELSPVINAYRDLCRYDKAEALCDTILETETNQFARAHAIYFKGMQMLHRYETEGIDYVYHAIDLNKNYMKDGFDAVEEYCTLCGLADELEHYRRRAETQLSAHAYNHEGAGTLRPTDRLIPEEELGGMLPDILAYMEKVSEGCIREIYLVRKVISEDFFSSVFVINFEYGFPRETMRRAYEAIFNYLDAYPVDWQFSLFVYDRETEAAVKKIEGSLVWEKKEG